MSTTAEGVLAALPSQSAQKHCDDHILDGEEKIKEAYAAIELAKVLASPVLHHSVDSDPKVIAFSGGARSPGTACQLTGRVSPRGGGSHERFSIFMGR